MPGRDRGRVLGTCPADVAVDPRWPKWGPAVAELGLRSVLSLRLETKARRYGSLNLYAEQVGAFDDDDLAVATIFVRHASVALANAHNEEGLQVAIDARKLIGQAQGILMERFDISPTGPSSSCAGSRRRTTSSCATSPSGSWRTAAPRTRRSWRPPADEASVS